MNILKKGFMFLSNRGFFNRMSDKAYLKLRYNCIMGKKLNLDNPVTYNEKLQWLKLYDRKPEYTKMVDKYEAKKYVADIIGEEYIIPTLGVWDNVNDIDFDTLPNQFVLKCTHDSGGLVICKDKSELDIENAKNTLNHFLNRNFYNVHREWPYKDVQPRIIAEKYMEDESGKDLKDYKFFCFNGEPKLLYISEGLSDHSTAKISFADMDYNIAEFKRNDFKPFDELPKKPINFEKMKELAKVLSKDRAFIRVDFYEINKKIFFGELTFFPCSGYLPFDPEKYDKILGDWITLPNKMIQE